MGRGCFERMALVVNDNPYARDWSTQEECVVEEFGEFQDIVGKNGLEGMVKAEEVATAVNTIFQSSWDGTFEPISTKAKSASSGSGKGVTSRGSVQQAFPLNSLILRRALASVSHFS